MQTPVEIKRVSGNNDKVGVEITWDNGEFNFFEAKFLRENCPCATCETARGSTSHDKPLASAPLTGRASLKVITSSQELECKIDKIWAVGNYALGIRWGDKHDSGIYSWKYIAELAQESTNDR